MFTWELTLKQSEVRYLLITVVLIDVCLLNNYKNEIFTFFQMQQQNSTCPILDSEK